MPRQPAPLPLLALISALARIGTCVGAAAVIAINPPRQLVAQAPSPSPAPAAGAFIGRVRADVDSGPVRSADIRLMFVDSARAIRGADGKTNGYELFPDSTRTRYAATDSSGAFAIRALGAGRYIVNVRRIGFEPLQAIVPIDSEPIRTTFEMHQVSQRLAKVVITENASDRVSQILTQDGFSWRSKAEPSGRFIQRADIVRYEGRTVAELLDAFGIRETDPVQYHLNFMPTDYDQLRSYPADLVLGVEIYRHTRPIEFNATRPNEVSSGFGSTGQSLTNGRQANALVIIWTYR